MRILGSIEHPALKITVFRMDNRISIKFENSGYEQTFKLGDDDRLKTLEDVQKWLDGPLVQEILYCMEQMHKSKLAAFARCFPQRDQEQFEVII